MQYPLRHPQIEKAILVLLVIIFFMALRHIVNFIKARRKKRKTRLENINKNIMEMMTVQRRNCISSNSMPDLRNKSKSIDKIVNETAPALQNVSVIRPLQRTDSLPVIDKKIHLTVPIENSKLRNSTSAPNWASNRSLSLNQKRNVYYTMTKDVRKFRQQRISNGVSENMSVGRSLTGCNNHKTFYLDDCTSGMPIKNVAWKHTRGLRQGQGVGQRVRRPGAGFRMAQWTK